MTAATEYAVPKVFIYVSGGNIQGVRVRDIPIDCEVQIVDEDDLGRADARAVWRDIEKESDGIY